MSKYNLGIIQAVIYNNPYKFTKQLNCHSLKQLANLYYQLHWLLET